MELTEQMHLELELEKRTMKRGSKLTHANLTFTSIYKQVKAQLE